MALVHRCRFVEWVPEQILCLSTNANNLLAVGRINGDIEIWNPAKATLYSGKKITGQSGQSLRCITWGKGEGSQRLFSGTDLGYIHEWNLLTLRQEASIDSFGGWVTSMSVNGSGTRLAAGTHDGVTVFDISEGNLSYMHKLHNSILTAAVYFHPTENTLYTGSGNLIRIYQPNGPKFVETGTIKLDAKVASLLVLPDYTVVVGTTKGGVQMWNGKTKVRVATFNEHQSSVVALASTPSGDSVFASGEDPKICMFRQHEDNKWVYTNHQRRHTHEVSSLVVLKNRVISGSSDTMLIFYEQAAFLANVGFHGIHKIFPYPHSPLLSFSSSSRFVLFRKNDGLELWRLGSAAVKNSERIGEMVIPVASTPVKLLDMELKKDRHYLRTSAISPKGKYIACASINSVKLFAVEYSEDNTVTVEPIDLPYEILNPHRLALTDKHLILVNQESLQVLDLASREILFEKDLAGDEGEDYKYAPINTIATSVDGAYVAVGDLNNNIHVFDLNKKMNICTLPKLPRQHTALGLQPTTSAIAVVDITGHFVMYDYLKKAFTPWSSQLDSTLPATFALCTKTDTVVGVSFDSNSPSTMLLWSSRFIAAVKIEDEVSAGPATKRTKSNSGKPIPSNDSTSSSPSLSSSLSSSPSSSSSSTTTPKLTLNVIGKYSDIMGVEFVDDGNKSDGNKSELVVVERPWLEIIPHLPNVFDLKLFGR